MGSTQSLHSLLRGLLRAQCGQLTWEWMSSCRFPFSGKCEAPSYLWVVPGFFYGLDFVWAWLDPIWCVKHAEELALLCLDKTLLIIELDASFRGTLYGFMLVEVMFFVILPVDGNVIYNADGSLTITVCLVNLELEYIPTHSYTKRHPKEAEPAEWRIEGC